MTCGDNGGRKWNGDPCERHPSKGFLRCFQHGGKNPGTKVEAELALAKLRMPAIAALFDVIEQLTHGTCLACGFPTGDIEEKKLLVHTAAKILDRTGFGPGSKIELTSQSDGAVNLDLLEKDELDALLPSLAVVKAIKERLRARMAGRPVETPLPKMIM